MSALDSHIDHILFTPSQIADRVSSLAAELTADLSSSSSSSPPPVFVVVATGGFIFAADLVRRVSIPVTVDFVRASSYGEGTVSSGEVRVTGELKVDVKGKHVILVEDIVDTGHTLSCLISRLESEGASSVSVCAFLDKPTRRKIHFKVLGSGKYYRGFECPDYFVVGYGMDFAELYRNLPYIGVLKPEYYK
ncbi:hypothetical protein Droror1_Dr00019630 [Drosera rotundifolia]